MTEIKFKRRKRAKDSQLEESKRSRPVESRKFRLESGFSRFAKVEDSESVLAGDAALEAVASSKIKNNMPQRKALDVSYEFGDSQSSYRMRKYERCLNLAKETGESLESIASKRYESLADFAISKEEYEEINKKESYSGYVMRKKPIGVYLDSSLLKEEEEKEEDDILLSNLEYTPQQHEDNTESLNKIKAEMIKAKLRNQTELYTQLEKKFQRSKSPETTNIYDEEKFDADSYNLANIKAIAQNSQFQDSHEYMDSLSSSTFTVSRNLKNTLTKKIQQCTYCLDNEKHVNNDLLLSIGEYCYVCFNVPGVSLYPNAPPSLMVAPTAHCKNMLSLKTEESKEFFQFMTAIRDYYRFKGYDTIFYESSATKHRHCLVKAIAIPKKDIKALKGYFRNAILASGQSSENTKEFDDEGDGNIALLNDVNSVHQVLVDTDVTSNSSGKPFRQLIAKEANYFHVWLSQNGGYGHIIEDRSWPLNEDLFVLRVIGGFLKKDKFNFEKRFKTELNWSDFEGGTKDYSGDALDGMGKQLEGRIRGVIDETASEWSRFDPQLT